MGPSHKDQKVDKSNKWALINIYNIGKSHGDNQEERTRFACMEQSTVIPKARGQQKDHKPTVNGVTKARFLCNATNSMNQIASNILTLWLNRCKNSRQGHKRKI